MKNTLERALMRMAERQRGMPRQGASETISRGLSAIRTHLGMEVAFISEFADDRRFFRYVDSADQEAIIRVGDSDPLMESYCKHVVDGRLPELMVDACLNETALTLNSTLSMPVRAHMSVPIRLKDGSVFGTLCCFSRQADPSLTTRDLAMLRVFSELVADQVEAELHQQQERRRLDQNLERAMLPGQLHILFQPVFSMEPLRVVGLEALSRFRCEPQRPPDQWFAEAATIGQGTALELHAIRLALQALDRVPQDMYLAINASPNTVIDPELGQTLLRYPLHRLVLEVTEHEEVEQYQEVALMTRPLRSAGLRVAVDDAGAGYASFKHILNLAPDIIKLDVSITRDIDTDLSRQALAAALVRFVESTRGQLVAEGAETEAELATLRSLNVRLAQGYALGRPMELEAALELARECKGD